MKIIFLDRKTLGDDVDLSGFERFGEVKIYDMTSPEEAPERVKDADILVVNKVPVNEQTCGGAKKLQLICEAATGTNNLDKDFLARRGIPWRNVGGYSTESVVQHTFAMLFYLFEHVPYYDHYVKSGEYMRSDCFTHFAATFHELAGKRWGIIGLGTIGSRVAQVAQAFGCRVQYYSASGHNHNLLYDQVDLDTLLATSDIISIHTALTDATYHLINQKTLGKMKKSAYLINVGRGPIIDEKALVDALNEGQIAGAGLDVLDKEPMEEASPFWNVKNKDNLLITPHVAWGTVEARQRLMKKVEKQVEEFLRYK